MALLKRRATTQTPVEPDGGLYFASPKENIQFIPSGCTMLDCALGGGWAIGRTVNICGDKSTGKTQLAIEACANFMLSYPKGTIRYNESESAFDTGHAEGLGVDFDRVSFWDECETVEDLIGDVDNVMSAQAEASEESPCLYIVDSLDSLSDKAEKERSVEDASYGAAKAKKLSEFFRRSIQGMQRARICLMILSQLRDNMNAGPFGKKHIRSGGKALDFYASQVVWLTHKKRLTKSVNKIERVYGIRVEAKIEKNKVSMPFRDAEYEIKFGYGIDDDKCMREFMTAAGMNASKYKTAAEMRKACIERWYEIERTFLPTERKYGVETET